MPCYEFVCDVCGFRKEVHQSIHLPVPEPGTCESCKMARMRYVWSVPNLGGVEMSAREQRELSQVLGQPVKSASEVDRILQEKGWERASGSRSYVRRPEPSKITYEEVKRIIDPPIEISGT